MKELKSVLSALSETKTSVTGDSVSLPSGELKPEQMVKILRRVFGEHVDIIDPLLSLQSSPLATGVVQMAGMVQYLQALRPLSKLKKPIILLVAQPHQEAKSRSQVTVNGWRAAVIVPRNYCPLDGQPVGNDQNPLLYYFDPQRNLSPNQAPPEIIVFCQVLIRGCRVPGSQQGRPVMIQVERVFAQLGFFHGCRSMCTETTDSAWWSLYFAIMAVSRGGVQFPETEKLSLSRLQTVLGALLTEQTTAKATKEAKGTVETLASPALSSASSVSSTVETLTDSSCSASLSSSESERTVSSSSEAPAEKNSLLHDQKPLGRGERERPSVGASMLADSVQSISLPTLQDSPPKISEISDVSRFSDEKKAPVTESKYEGPAYTPTILAGIFRAYQVLPIPDIKSSQDSSNHFSLTAYPLQNLTETVFLQDVLQDWQVRQGRLENRRVAYLFSAAQAQNGQAQCLGLVIQYAAPNTAVANEAWRKHTELRTAKLTTLLETPDLVKTAPQFYGPVQITVLGVGAQSAIVAQLKVPLEKVCRGQVALSFKAIPFNAAYPVILMEDLLGMLRHGRTQPVEPATAAVEHRQRCLQAIVQRWELSEDQNVSLQQTFQTSLRTVLILATLHQQRQSGYRVNGEETVSPRVRKERDLAMKRHLYAQRFSDRRTLIEGLPLTVLASFLISEDIADTLKSLNQHQDQLRTEIVKWEIALQDEIHRQHLTPCDYVTQAWRFMYQSSFLGFGGELFRLLGYSITGEGKPAKPEEKSASSAQDLAAQEAQWIGQQVKRLTRSEALSSRSETTVRIFLGTEPISRSLGVLGTLCGAVVQIALGPYTLVQMLGVAVLTQTGYHSIESNRLDDSQAELRDPAMSLTALHRLSVLVWHGGEALALGSLTPLISAVGSLAGSVVPMRLTPSSSRESKTEKREPMGESAILWSLLLRQVGAALGQRGAWMLWRVAVNIQHRILYRDTAIALLSHAASRQPGLSEWRIEGADFRHPRLWLNGQHNPLALSWITQSGVHRQVACEIQSLPVLTPAGIAGLVCTSDILATEISTTLGLPKP